MVAGSARPLGVIVLALVALVGGAAWLHRRAVAARDRGRRAEAETFARILQGLSRSISPAAIVEAMLSDLGRVTAADHCVVVRFEAGSAAPIATLVSMHPGVPSTTTVLPAAAFNRADPADQDQLTERLAAGAEAAFGIGNTLAVPLRHEAVVIGAIILSRRSAEAVAGRHPAGPGGRGDRGVGRAEPGRFDPGGRGAGIDRPLTGLPNRRYFEEFCSLLGRRRRSADDLDVGVLMVDIDWFKRVNDTYGHGVGDQVLRAVAGAIAAAVREGDVPARFGGEEFAVLLRHATAPIALEVAERVRLAVGQLDLREWRVPGVSVSVGVAVGDRSDEPIGELLAGPTGRCTGPSGAAATRSSPPDVRIRPGRDQLGRYHPGMVDAEADPPLLSNAQLAAIFHEIGDMLEVKGELVFKTVAYHRAADAIGHHPVEIARAYREGNPPRIPGVGQAISDKLAELSQTGHLAFYDRLSAEVPAGLVGLLARSRESVRRPSGSSTRSIGVDNLDDLRKAAEEGRLRTVKGLSDKAEASILAGIASLESRADDRMLLGDGRSDHRAARRGAVHGSRRHPDRAGWLVSPAAGDDRRPGPAGRDGRCAGPGRTVRRRCPTSSGSSGRAATRRRSTLHRRSAGRPDDHAARRGRDVPRPLHRLERSQHPPAWNRPGSRLEPVREGLPADRRGRRARRSRPSCGRSRPRPRRTRFLDLPFIEPELREDQGEIEAAQAGRLPALVSLADLRGDLHSHSDWSDGVHSIEQMAEAARERGHAYQVLTDHTRSPRHRQWA